MNDEIVIFFYYSTSLSQLAVADLSFGMATLHHTTFTSMVYASIVR